MGAKIEKISKLASLKISEILFELVSSTPDGVACE